MIRKGGRECGVGLHRWATRLGSNKNKEMGILSTREVERIYHGPKLTRHRHKFRATFTLFWRKGLKWKLNSRYGRLQWLYTLYKSGIGTNTKHGIYILLKSRINIHDSLHHNRV